MTIHLTESQIGSLFVTYDGRVVKVTGEKIQADWWRVELEPPVPSKYVSGRQSGWCVSSVGEYINANSAPNHKASLKEPLAFTECPY